jgi:hypothetical protein
VTKPVKWADRVDPDAWVVWDDGLDRWVEAKLIRSTERPEPLLVDEFGRHHTVGNDTRCQRAVDLIRLGDLTKIPHTWLVDESRRMPSGDLETLMEQRDLDSGFQLRDWNKVR